MKENSRASPTDVIISLGSASDAAEGGRKNGTFIIHIYHNNNNLKKKKRERETRAKGFKLGQLRLNSVGAHWQ